MSDDKPGHVLEISDALGRDLDKAAQGKIPAPPVEAFLSDETLREIDQATDAYQAPVDVRNLTPITRAEAARRTTFDGEHLPAMPATRRVRPAPFARERVSGGSHGKTWQQVRADQVQPGDIIPGLGRVTEIGEDLEYGQVAGYTVPMRILVKITGAGGNSGSFRPETSLNAFR